MKKLTIIFKDKSSVVYTMRNSISYVPYFARHSKKDIESAVLQQYPKSKNKPIILISSQYE